MTPEDIARHIVRCVSFNHKLICGSNMLYTVIVLHDSHALHVIFVFLVPKPGATWRLLPEKVPGQIATGRRCGSSAQVFSRCALLKLFVRESRYMSI